MDVSPTDAQSAIDRAAEHGVTLELSDFSREGGELTIDGMPADEWIDAVIIDHGC